MSIWFPPASVRASTGFGGVVSIVAKRSVASNGRAIQVKGAIKAENSRSSKEARPPENPWPSISRSITIR
jgi:hypothetical protein